MTQIGEKGNVLQPDEHEECIKYIKNEQNTKFLTKQRPFPERSEKQTHGCVSRSRRASGFPL